MANVVRPDLTEEPAYKSLKSYFNDNGKAVNLRQLFNEDNERHNKFRYS